MPRARVDRYVLKEFGAPFAFGLAGFTFVLLINYLFLLARQTIEKRVPVRLVLGFVLAKLPYLLILTLPMAVLLATLVGIGRMASQHEVVALQAAGIAPARLARPLLGAAVVATAASLLTAHFLVPLGNVHARSLAAEVVRSRDLSREIDPGVFYNRLPGTVLYARSAADAPGQGRVLEGILLHQEAPDRSVASLVVAARGRAVFDRETGRVSLLLDDGERHLWQPGRGGYSVIRFSRFTMTFPPDAAFQALVGSRRRDHRDAVGAALPALIRKYAKEAAEARSAGRRLAARVRLRKARLEWHRRWALPVAVLALALAAFPLAVRSRRGGRFVGLSQALSIIFLFWLVLNVGLGLSEQGTWPPWLGPWLPDGLVGLWAVVLWLRLGHRRRLPFATRLAGLLPRFGRRRPAGGGFRPERWAGFTRLDAYLTAGHLRYLAAGLAVLLLLTSVLEFKEGFEAISPDRRDLPWGDLLAYVGLALPGRLRFLLPIAALFAAMVSLAVIAQAGEIVALKASGIGPPRIAAPLLLATLAVSAVYALTQETLVPAAARESQRALERLRGRPSTDDIQTGRRWLVGEDGALWSMLGWDGRRKTILAPSVTLVDPATARIVERIEARQARFVDGTWRFTRGWRRVFRPDAAPPRYETFDTYASPLSEPPETFGETRRRLLLGRRLADQMSFAELRAHLQRVARSGYDATPLRVGLYEKLAQPLLPVLLVLLGAPLMLSGGTRHRSRYGFGLALLITFAFWSLWAVTTSFGREGALAPELAVWLPPALLAAGGTALLARAR
ncbi:MAG: YjgP/YjgQ family permease [Acidobacteria bacterium]|nr:MAG: YjgP/YjgQ family permease [Acidobacteriota bacterium]